MATLAIPQRLHVHFLSLSLKGAFVGNDRGNNLAVKENDEAERQEETPGGKESREALVAETIGQVVERAGQKQALQFVGGPDAKHRRNAYRRRVQQGEGDHKKSDAGRDLLATEALHDDVITIVANHYDEPERTCAEDATEEAVELAGQRTESPPLGQEGVDKKRRRLRAHHNQVGKRQ